MIKAASLHDIGKVGIPDHILLKEGRLSPDELRIIRTHSRIGSDALEGAMQGALSDEALADPAAERQPNDAELVAALDSLVLGPSLKSARESGPFAFLRVAQQIARSHHERWDGSGYPDGLAGEAIPIPARLMALADVFDALVCQRIHKPAFTADVPIAEILARSGSHFDPAVVDVFLAAREEFCAIAARYADDERTPRVGVGVHREQELE
jgi:putative two-component system response regulator